MYFVNAELKFETTKQATAVITQLNELSIDQYQFDLLLKQIDGASLLAPPNATSTKNPTYLRSHVACNRVVVVTYICL